MLSQIHHIHGCYTWSETEVQTDSEYVFNSVEENKDTVHQIVERI